MVIPAGAAPSVYWEEPGNKKDGYCKEKDQMLHACPACKKALHNRSLKVVMPPGRNGCAGPMMITFLWNTDDTDNKDNKD